jgi:guanylate kinase
MDGLIFALVGPSGSGKTALIEEMLRRFPDVLVSLRSITTRSRRETDDDGATRFISRAEFVELIDLGLLIQWVEYDGNLYGDALSDVSAILAAGKFGIRPLTDEGVRNFRAQGYGVPVARIRPIGSGYKNRSLVRETIDLERAKEAVVADMEINNRFDPKGFEEACDKLEAFISWHLTSRRPPA